MLLQAQASRLLQRRGFHNRRRMHAAAAAVIKDTAAPQVPGAMHPPLAASPPEPKPTRLLGSKRTVAMHIAYVGTEFRGLQLSRDSPAESTVEGVLELALLKAELIAPSNYGDLHKLHWTRSSRTDKGVHSLATVIGARIVLPGMDDAYATDPEGLAIAGRINAHLPSSVKVLSAQRVNKNFSARRAGMTRSYEYFLPSTVLGLRCDGGEEDARKLSLLRGVLRQFEGTHPFHNYTAHRKRYLPPRPPGAAADQPESRYKRKRKGPDVLDDDDASSIDTEAEEEEQMEEERGVAAAGCDDHVESSAGVVDRAGSGAQEVARLWWQQCEWVAEASDTNRVGVRHYRTIRDFSAADPEPLTPGGVACVKIKVTGGSFMLNQIRHMIGAAVAVARGVMPGELVAISLAVPARVTVPKAPPHTLLLADSEFLPFRSTGGKTAEVAKYSGDTLALREGGGAAQGEFRQTVLAPALEQLCGHPDWELFSQGLERTVWDTDKLAQVRNAFAAWEQARRAQLAARRQEEADADTTADLERT